MTKPQLQGLRLFLLGSVLLVLVGVSFQRRSIASMADFKAVYCGARALLEHRDAYNPAEMQRIFLDEASGHASDPPVLRSIIGVYIYPPSAFLLTIPFAWLTWGPAHILWTITTAATFLLAAFLMWKTASDKAPVIVGGMLCFFLATSELLIEVGNAAGICVSLCVIAVWCFLKNRFVFAGIVCLAISLAVKPHDAGLVWLYFLLAGGIHRIRALQTLAVTAVLCLPFFLWVSSVSPSWPQEMRANLAAHSAHGADSDPGPDGLKPKGHGAQLISLQTVLSVFRDDPAFYNPASYLLIGIPLLIWCFVVARTPFSIPNAWLALAAVVALSMLATYHRQQDTRLILLSFPAFAILWAEGGRIRSIALIVNAVGVFFTGDLPLQILGILASHVGASPAGALGKLLTILLARPAPLALLAMGLFYLYVFVRRAIISENGIEAAKTTSSGRSVTRLMSNLMLWNWNSSAPHSF